LGIHPPSTGWSNAAATSASSPSSNVGWQVEKPLEGYLEYASLALGEIYQLAAALKYLESIGLDRIEAQSLALVERLRTGLTAQGFKILTPQGTRSSIVSFYIREESAAAEKVLEEARVKVSLQTGDRTEGYQGTGVTRVRVSLSFSTTRKTATISSRYPRNSERPDGQPGLGAVLGRYERGRRGTVTGLAAST
jgi:selenocysteine lyase/cysteine desulfurase